MEWTDIVKTIFEVCIVPILGVLTAYIVMLLRKKAQQVAERTKNEQLSKAILDVSELVAKAVQMTNQTYVESLKDKDLFDADAQKDAFDKTYNAVFSMLSEETKGLLINEFGDLSKYLTAQIESQVHQEKE